MTANLLSRLRGLTARAVAVAWKAGGHLAMWLAIPLWVLTVACDWLARTVDRLTTYLAAPLVVFSDYCFRRSIRRNREARDGTE